VFAVRGYTGTFFGNSPKQYVLGGVDNWFGNTINYGGVKNPLYVPSGFNDNLIFTEFATTLRGFDYATLYGTSVAMANAEFRLPLYAHWRRTCNFKFLPQHAVHCVYDIGTSWTGAPPTSTEILLERSKLRPDPSRLI